MEKLLFFPLLFLQFYPVLILSQTYKFPDKYFINCGSNSPDAGYGSRKFGGDSFYAGNSEAVKSTNQSADSSALYQTARLSSRSFWYDLDMTETGRGSYVLRLHFFPFESDQANPSDFMFNVTASSKSLISNLSFRNTSSSSFPVIKDFLVPVNTSRFRINFIPTDHQPSFAFVNAIEVFKIPNLKDNPIHVTSAGSKGLYHGLSSQVLRTVLRVDIGPARYISNPDQLVVAPEWVADDEFLVIGDPRNYNYSDVALNYVANLDFYTENYTAALQNFVPDSVYKTYREVSLDDGQASNSTVNITWHFNVSKNAQHLVRAHFCDFISDTLNMLNFSLVVYNNFYQQIATYVSPDSINAVPFYYDVVVDSGDFDFISISVVPWNNDSTMVKKAFLNGLEIMEFITELGSEPGESERKRKPVLIIIIGSVIGALAVFILIVVFLLRKQRQKRKRLEPMVSYGTLPFGGGSLHNGLSGISVNPPPVSNLNLKLKMPFAEILEATNNFEAKLLIGEGGFGKVYKGTLRNGTKVAVKRSESKHGQGLPEFQTEVLVLSKIRHRHLVSLIGYCDEGSEMILVYEFMEKGTLRDHLYESRGDLERSSPLSLLTWRPRLEICIGAAKGLHYLHTGSDGGIIHRDVKSTNILLDEQYVAKVADFGLSKLGVPDPDEFCTGVKGSFGYLDPEYLRCYQLTEKSDVYSFGVVLLEVLCARPAIINSPTKEEINLAEWGLLWLNKGELEKIIDPSLVGQINPNSLRKFSELVEKCLKPNGSSRPTMLDICWDLEYTLQLQQTAVRREPHEDSAIDASLEFSSGPFQRLPSSAFPVEKDVVPIDKDDGSETSASVVFSELRIDGGR